MKGCDMNGPIREGGCLCGRVRYRVAGEPLWVAYCHCQSCRRHTGSVMTAFVGFLKADYEIVSGTPVARESSPGVWRRHCGDCGSPLTYEARRVDRETHVYLGTLDQPAGLKPQSHVFTEEAVPWLKVADALPRHARLGRAEEAT
jgi:hypothetical protein